VAASTASAWPNRCACRSGLHHCRSDAAPAKFLQHFDIVNTGNTRAAAKRRLGNGPAFVARRKVPDLPWLHKGHHQARRGSALPAP